jgi:cytoskeletal protein CcmA (bactofilin family)
MFTKNTKKLESFIGVNSIFRGDIETKGTLRIDGTVDGNVNADWVILGGKATLNGNITATGIIIDGNVVGNLTANESIEIKPKGQVHGDISSIKLTIAEGGLFDGRSIMGKEESKIVEFSAKG